MAKRRSSNQLIRQFKFSDLWTTRRGPLVAFVAVFAIVGITLLVRTYASGGVTVFSGSTVPKTADSGDTQAVELGFKFKSDVAGTVTGVRFYKSAQNTGTHVGNLWSNTGTKLASVTFSGETASGWQQATFSSPVTITPGTLYVVSYHTNSGHYSDDSGGFTSAIDSAPLHAPADGASGPNGVYAYGSTSTFPASGWQSSNYWVDVVFNPVSTPSPTPTPTPTPAPVPALSLDQQVVVHPASQTSTVTSPALSTSGPNDLLEAFVMTDGPNTSKSMSVSSVSGAGLTWTLRQRSNTQAGSSEIWQAVAPAKLTNATVTASLSSSQAASMVVAAFKGADVTTNGAVASANATTGAPKVSLTTTRNGSWVWAAGNDYDNATARTMGAGQTLVDQYLAPVGDTYWVQRQAGPTPASGTAVTMSDTAPTADRWNLAAIEILPAVATATPSPTPTPSATPSPTPAPSTSPSPSPTPTPDALPPTQPTNVTATGTSSTQISLSWTASTDNVAVTGYQVYRNGIRIATTTGPGYSDTGLAPNTAYSYFVRATDAAGNLSANSATVTASTPASPDTTAPSTPTGLTATAASPSQVNLSWTASTDNVGVTSYLVLRNNVVIATPTGTSYSDTTLAANTAYSYKVEAKDAAGNVSAPSATANVTTPNPPDTTPPSVPTGLTATAVSSTQVNLSWSASTDNVAVAGYNIYRGGTKIATSTTTSFGDGTATAGTSYSYKVSAYDGAGNTSAQSTAASVTTPGGATPTPTPISSGTCAPYPKFPDASCTGPTGTLTTYTGSQTFNTPGQVIQNVVINTSSGLTVTANNVTFRNCKIIYSGSGRFDTGLIEANPVTGLVVDHCEIDGKGVVKDGIHGGDNFTVSGCNIHGVGNGVEAGSAFTVKESYIWDIYTPQGYDWHADGVQGWDGASNMVVDHNTILMPTSNFVSGVVDFVGTTPQSNNLVQHNLLAGGGYTVYVGSTTSNSNVRVLNNHYSTRYFPKVGVYDIYYPVAGGVTVSGNVIDETGAPADTNL
jgi:chitodextrinase